MIAVRPGTLEDAAGIARVQVAAWHAAYGALLPSSVLDAFDFESRLTRWQRNLAAKTADLRTAVAIGAGEVIGFACTGRSRERSGWGKFRRSTPRPVTWGTGVGHALLVDGLAHLDSLRLSLVELWVLDGNERAIAFYRRHGFELDGARRLDERASQLRMARL